MVALVKMVLSVLCQSLRIGEGQDLPAPRLGLCDSCALQRRLRWLTWVWLVPSEQQLSSPVLRLLVDWSSFFPEKPADSPFLLLSRAADCVCCIRVRFRRDIEYMVANFNRIVGSCAAGRESAGSLAFLAYFF